MNQINVLEHGVVADGVTDNTAMIQAVIDAVNESPIDSWIVFGLGDYLITKPIRIPKRLRLIGHGANIIFDPNQSWCAFLVGLDVTLKGFTYNANGANRLYGSVDEKP